MTAAAPTWRLTPAALGWIVVGVGVALLGVLIRRPEIVALGVPLLIGGAWGTAGPAVRATDVRLAGTDQPPGASGLRATARLEPGPGPGAAVTVIRVSAPGHRPAEAVLHSTPRTVGLAMRSVRTGRRELFVLDHRDAGPDQLLATAARTPQTLTLTVLPGIRPLDELPLPDRLQGLTGPHASRRAGEGGDLHDVGPFRPGDRLRRVDWRVTARLNSGPPVGGAAVTQLYVRRTFATADATVMLVVDSRDEVGPRLATWGDASALREDEATSLDIARTAAASLARHYLAGGDRVGLEDLGRLRRPVPPAGGRHQQLRLLQRLALSEPEGEPLRRQRVPRLPSGSLIIVFSTFLDDEAARMSTTWHRAGHRVLAVDTLPRLVLGGVSPRLHTAYRMIAMERVDRLRALQRQGVEPISWSLAATGADPALELGRLARLRRRPRTGPR